MTGIGTAPGMIRDGLNDTSQSDMLNRFRNWFDKPELWYPPSMATLSSHYGLLLTLCSTPCLCFSHGHGCYSVVSIIGAAEPQQGIQARVSEPLLEFEIQ